MIDLNFILDTEQIRISLTAGTKPDFYLRTQGPKGASTDWPPSEPLRMEIICPPNTDFSSSERQEWLTQVVLNQLRRRARAVLPLRLQTLAKKHGFTVNRVAINAARTRWGSCSSRGNVNLSLFLLLLPSHLIDYVLLHELCHLREMNHGPRFWELLNSLTDGRAKTLREEMHRFEPSVRPFLPTR